jgi:hypothetical protein
VRKTLLYFRPTAFFSVKLSLPPDDSLKWIKSKSTHSQQQRATRCKQNSDSHIRTPHIGLFYFFRTIKAKPALLLVCAPANAVRASGERGAQPAHPHCLLDSPEEVRTPMSSWSSVRKFAGGHAADAASRPEDVRARVVGGDGGGDAGGPGIGAGNLFGSTSRRFECQLQGTLLAGDVPALRTYLAALLHPRERPLMFRESVFLLSGMWFFLVWSFLPTCWNCFSLRVSARSLSLFVWVHVLSLSLFYLVSCWNCFSPVVNLSLSNDGALALCGTTCALRGITLELL